MRNEQDIIHKEEEQIRGQQEAHEDDHVIKLNQSLPPQANFILFILIALSLLSNSTHGYDYNVVIGCGIYFLSSKHPFLHKMPYFYILVLLTICSDGLVIALLWEKVDLFHSLIVPGIQILLKIIFLIVQVLYWRKQSEEQKQILMRKSFQNAGLLKEMQQRKIHQAQKLKYLQSKQQLKPNPKNYYISKNVNVTNLQQTYKSQSYREFDCQQFTTDPQQQIQSNYMRKN